MTAIFHRLGLLARFVAVLVPVFLALSGLGLYALHNRDTRAERDALTARVGNRAARAADALSRHAGAADASLLQDLLVPLADDPAIQCVELRGGPRSTLLAALPPALGCRGHAAVQVLHLEVGHDGVRTLTVHFAGNELAQRAAARLRLALGILGAAFAIAVISATVGFRFIVAGPLGRLRAAIRYSAATGRRARVSADGRDELSDIIRAYDAMTQREIAREEALATARRSLVQSEEALRRLNGELEHRVAQRTAELAVEEAKLLLQPRAQP